MRTNISHILILTAITAALCLPLFSCKNTGDAVNETRSVIEGSMVKVHYTLTVDGAQVDSSIEGEPMEFQVGASNVIPGFINGIMGMKIGEKRTFRLRPDEAYGPVDPAGIQEVSTSELPPDIAPEPGMTLYGNGPNGEKVAVKVMEVKDDTVVLNFNHPLAGKDLDFEVEMVEINLPATQ